MSVEIEIEVKGDKCEHCGAEMEAKPAEPTKDELLAELKKMLNDNSSNGMAERQMKIDELMAKISEMGKED